MNVMENKKTQFLALFALLVIIILPLITAFGVAIPYWDSPEWYPLKLAPGESKIVTLTLQNTGEQDMTFRARLTSGSEIATLIDKNLDYSVPSGEVNKQVSIQVEIPENADLKSQYEISVSFQQVSSGGSGMVSLATGIVASFPVEIVGYGESVKRTEVQEAPAPESAKNYTWLVILIILIAITVVAIFINRSQKSKVDKIAKKV